MKNIPQEVIYVLIFAAILLFQYLMRRGARQEPQDSAQDALALENSDEMPAETHEWGPAAPAASSLSRASVDPLRRPESPTALSAAPRRRFDRRSLMGNKREVQNAIVIAAILGPCRAFEPHEVR